MIDFNALPTAEKARQLANPEGETGIAVAEWLNASNKNGNAATVEALGITTGCSVLEIGFGNGQAAADVVGRAAQVSYVGIDISPTMVDEANRRNAQLVAAGSAQFLLGSAERMPFADACFDRAFAVGVIHFWREPAQPLAELRRVMRPGGFCIMGCLDPRTPLEFARPEHGFHLREPAEWEALFLAAGFQEARAVALETEGINPDGSPTKRYAVTVTTRT